MNEDCYSQFYFNEKTGVTNYVLIGALGRLYGRDCFDGRWHRHPFEKPEEHDFSEEGSRKLGPDEFLCEIIEWSLTMYENKTDPSDER
ncbi:MAG: hypothetical protein V1862_07625 [Methanobacteriota archaeon]